MTDVLRRTNRWQQKSADTDLWITEDAPKHIVDQFQLNYDIENMLKQFRNVESLYFTSNQTKVKSPFGWFKTIFYISPRQRLSWRAIGIRKWCCELTINSQTYKIFLLPTPSPRSLHFTDQSKTEIFCNYLKSIRPNRFQELSTIKYDDLSKEQLTYISTMRHNCLVECYRQALVYNNVDFDGSTNIG